MVHAVIDMISLSGFQGTLVLMVRLRCMCLMILFCSSANVTVVVCAVIVFIKLHPHGIQAMQVVENVEGKVIFVSHRVLVPVHIVGQRGVHGNLLRRDGRVLILKKVCPCSIDSWARLAEVEWKIGIHLSVYRVACMIEEEEVVGIDCREFVW